MCVETSGICFYIINDLRLKLPALKPHQFRRSSGFGLLSWTGNRWWVNFKENIGNLVYLPHAAMSWYYPQAASAGYVWALKNIFLPQKPVLWRMSRVGDDWQCRDLLPVDRRVSLNYFRSCLSSWNWICNVSGTITWSLFPSRVSIFTEETLLEYFINARTRIEGLLSTQNVIAF